MVNQQHVFHLFDPPNSLHELELTHLRRMNVAWIDIRPKRKLYMNSSLYPRKPLLAFTRRTSIQFSTEKLEKMRFQGHTLSMTNREIVKDLLQRIPENASLHDIAREIEFIAAVRQGLDELDRGKNIPIEEVERELPSWIIR